MESRDYISITADSFNDIAKDYEKSGGNILISSPSSFLMTGDAHFELFANGKIYKGREEPRISTQSPNFDKEKSRIYLIGRVPDRSFIEEHSEVGVSEFLDSKPPRYRFGISEMVVSDTDLLADGPTLFIPSSKSIEPAFRYALEHVSDKAPAKSLSRFILNEEAIDKIVRFVLEDIGTGKNTYGELLIV